MMRRLAPFAGPLGAKLMGLCEDLLHWALLDLEDVSEEDQDSRPIVQSSKLAQRPVNCMVRQLEVVSPALTSGVLTSLGAWFRKALAALQHVEAGPSTIGKR